MTLSDLQSKQIGILGFGMEGQAVLEYLTANNLSAKVFDSTQQSQWTEQQLKLIADTKTEVIAGKNYLQAAIEQVDTIFKSPGVLIDEHSLQDIQAKQITLTSQTAWFFEHCPAPIIGITGTKGKGTTSSLIYEILKLDTRSAYLTGNIGKQAPLSFLDQLTTEDLVVYELSSFQLEFLKQSPHLGVCLMVTNDHFDYHKNQTEYWSAKNAIAEYQTVNDLLIYNADYDGSKQIGQLGQGQKFMISRNLTSTAGALIDVDNNAINLTFNETVVVINTAKRQILGAHNLENIAAASLATALLGVSKETIEEGIAQFSGLPHRLQLVGEYNGVKFVDDSIATNPDTTIAAVNAFTDPVILILGGANKGLDYSEMVQDLKDKEQLKKVVLVGSVGKILYGLFQDANFGKAYSLAHNSFEEAIADAKSSAASGDVVLLSPAATSFDMFHNYAERGDRFTQLIKENNE